jgi:hypothetical protein
MYRIYAKFDGMSQFKPVDVSTGSLVTNLIHATLIFEHKLDEAKNYINQVKQDQPNISLQIRSINNKKIYSI